MVKDSRPKIVLEDHTINLYTIYNATVEHKTPYKWYKKKLATKIIRPAFDYAKKMDLVKLNFDIRKMKTKWAVMLKNICCGSI